MTHAEKRQCDVPMPLQYGFQEQAEKESSSGLLSLLSAPSFHSADTCKDFWCGVMTEYHNTDIRLIGQDNLLSVLVGIKSKPKPLLFPSLVFLPKYSKLLLANRKIKNKIRCIMLVSGEEEMGGRISIKR